MAAKSDRERKSAQWQNDDQHLQVQVTFCELCEKGYTNNDERQRETMDQAQGG